MFICLRKFLSSNSMPFSRYLSQRCLPCAHLGIPILKDMELIRSSRVPSIAQLCMDPEACGLRDAGLKWCAPVSICACRAEDYETDETRPKVLSVAEQAAMREASAPQTYCLNPGCTECSTHSAAH